MAEQIYITENTTTVEIVNNNPTTIEVNQTDNIIIGDSGITMHPAMAQIQDVDLDPVPTDGQVLTYDVTDGMWRPENGIRRSNMLVVDIAGKGDYATIKEACDFVATQTPGVANQWVIQVQPGYYTEAPFTIPTYCLVQGMGQTPSGNVAHCVRIQPADPWLGGTFITMGSLAAIDNCGIAITLDATATADGIGLSGNGRYTRCWFQGVNSTAGSCNLKLIAGGVVLQNCNVGVSGSNTTSIHCSDGSSVRYGWVYSSGAGTDIYAVVMTGHNDDVNISYTRFGANSGNFFNYDIKVDDGRAHVLHCTIKKYIGDVDFPDKWRSTASGLQEAIAATDVVATLKGAAAQTGNLLEARDSADALLASISAIGKISGSALAIGSLSGLLKATAGLVSAASAGTDFENPLTFSTGLTRAINAITADLSTGKSGGQSIIGGIGASENLTLQSTAHATKGKILFGTSAYDEVNNRLGIGTNAPNYPLHILGVVATDLPTYSVEFLLITGWTQINWTGDFTAGFTHTVGNVSVLSQSKAAVVNSRYQVTITITGRTAGTVTIAFGGQSYSTSGSGNWGPKATSTAGLTITPTTDFDGTVIVSIKSITAISTPIIALASSDNNNRFEIRTGSMLGNVFLGNTAGQYNTTGIYNVGVGHGALLANTTGTRNTAIGYNAASNITVGAYNVAIGYMALNVAVLTTYNTAIGAFSMVDCIGSVNVGVGSYSLFTLTTGNNNTAIGNRAGQSLLTGTGNLFLGYYAGYNALQKTDVNNSIAIGKDAYTNADNQCVIGSTSITQTLLNGNIGINNTSPTAQLDVKTAAISNIGIITRGIAGQTGNLFEARNSSDAVLASIDAAGIVKAAGYKSSDASAGLTQTVTVRNAAGDGTTTMTFKNGLLTGVA